MDKTRDFIFDQMVNRWIYLLLLVIQFSYVGSYLKALGPIRVHDVISVEWWCIIAAMAFTWVSVTLFWSSCSCYRPFLRLDP